MSIMKNRHDIDDNEIRIISGAGNKSSRRQPRKNVFYIMILVVLSLVIVTVWWLSNSPSDSSHTATSEITVQQETHPVIFDTTSDSVTESAYTAISDTTVDGVRLTVFTPQHAVPSLHIGTDILTDSTIVLAAQAADIRDDNGGIVGSYVLNGELKSKGQSKSGFCAIINDYATIGVADATSVLEQALESNGSFFRQYPLVVANQIVENKPKGRALRKSLAELNGRLSVIISHDRLTFHDFSQALTNLGVNNAIYLVGSSAYGFAVNDNGNKYEFGKPDPNAHANTNYIIWK